MVTCTWAGCGQPSELTIDIDDRYGKATHRGVPRCARHATSIGGPPGAHVIVGTNYQAKASATASVKVGDLVTGSDGIYQYTGKVKSIESFEILVEDSVGDVWSINPVTVSAAVPGSMTGPNVSLKPAFPVPPAQGLAPAAARPTIIMDVKFSDFVISDNRPKKPSGLHCAHCREYYEYAEAPSGRLVCYSCRSSGRK